LVWGLSPPDPLHGHSLAASPARTVPVARSLRSLASYLVASGLLEAFITPFGFRAQTLPASASAKAPADLAEAPTARRRALTAFARAVIRHFVPGPLTRLLARRFAGSRRPRGSLTTFARVVIRPLPPGPLTRFAALGRFVLRAFHSLPAVRAYSLAASGDSGHMGDTFGPNGFSDARDGSPTRRHAHTVRRRQRVTEIDLPPVEIRHMSGSERIDAGKVGLLET